MTPTKRENEILRRALEMACRALDDYRPGGCRKCVVVNMRLKSCHGPVCADNIKEGLLRLANPKAKEDLCKKQ